ncbi:MULTISPECIES: SixA phosphatase family protein [Pedobacter]|uniref:SixA phosphatase family protein n=1 Tax=Pedobacter TaxID=84567 RepID=UPI00210DD76D|nr:MULTISPECIES: histidine phosphatase family protein [unclassified Pedobacter]
MSKNLLLVRHGKSDWGNEFLSDFDRPLNPRGHDNAPMMARRLLSKGYIPDLIVSSPALRALSTAKHFAQVWEIPFSSILLKEDIYEASVPALLNVVNELGEDFSKVALFGHNPGLTDFVNYLTDANLYSLPTCGVAQISFPAEQWAEISRNSGSLVFADYPKNELA